jgi:hypothetical protein
LAGVLELWLACFVAALFAEEDLIVFPGNALAATSDSTAVSAREPAISQRFTRRSCRRAASRV